MNKRGQQYACGCGRKRGMGVGQMVGMGWWIVRDPVELRPRWKPRELTGLGEVEQDAA